MSDSNRVALRYIAEATYGTQPVGAGDNWSTARFTSETFSGTPNTTTSSEIRSDRQVADMPTVGLSVSGAIDIELAMGAYDDFMEAALCGTWGTSSATAATLEIDLSSLVNTGAAVAQSSFGLAVDGGAAADVIVAVNVGEYADNAALLVGVTGITGFTMVAKNGGAAEDGLFTLTSSTTGSTSTLVLSAGGTGVDLTLTGSDTGLAAIATSDVLRIGVVDRSFSFEKEFADIGRFTSFSGMRVGEFSLDMAHGSIMTGNFGFQGNGALAPTTATIIHGSSTTVPATTDGVMNASSDVGSLLINGSATGICINSMSLSLTNNLREETCVGTAAPTDVKKGSVGVTGSMEMYLTAEAMALYGQALANTAVSIQYVVNDLGRSYTFDIPNCRIQGDAPQSPGLDQDVMFSANFTALADADQTTLQITRDLTA